MSIFFYAHRFTFKKRFLPISYGFFCFFIFIQGNIFPFFQSQGDEVIRFLCFFKKGKMRIFSSFLFLHFFGYFFALFSFQ